MNTAKRVWLVMFRGKEIAENNVLETFGTPSFFYTRAEAEERLSREKIVRPDWALCVAECALTMFDKESILNKAHWTIADYKQRITAKQWREMLLAEQDTIVYQGEAVRLKARSLGFGVIEIFKDLPDAAPGAEGCALTVDCISRKEPEWR